MLSRILRVGLLLAVLGQIAWSFRPATTHAQTDQLREGQHLYEAGCSTCHGLDAQGTQNGPTLQGRGRCLDRLHAEHRPDAPEQPGHAAGAPGGQVHARADGRDHRVRAVDRAGRPRHPRRRRRARRPPDRRRSVPRQLLGLPRRRRDRRLRGRRPDRALAVPGRSHPDRRGHPGGARRDAPLQRAHPLRARRELARAPTCCGCATTGTRAGCSSAAWGRWPRASWPRSSGWAS